MPPIKPRAIHQFSIACSAGDGITNGMLLTQRLLQGEGIRSEIYCDDIDPQLIGQIRCYRDYDSHPDQVLLVHHGIGNGQESWLRSLDDRCFMVFHNITPANFFAEDHPIQPMLNHGWQQVDQWQSWLQGAIADSPHNLEILLQRGYSPDRCAAIPLLVDLELFQNGSLSDNCRPLGDGFRLLFVGQLLPHKNQHRLIETLYHLRRITGEDVRLTLVGKHSDLQYLTQVKQTIAEYGLTEVISLTGAVSHDRLVRYYQQSDLYLSLSRHEGFGMPLVEAMARQLPVMAYQAADSNVSHTVGSAGLLLTSDDPVLCAAAVAQLMETPQLRSYMVQEGLRHQQQFLPDVLYQQLRKFLANFAIELPQKITSKRTDAPRTTARTTARTTSRTTARTTSRTTAANALAYRIEGPYDSSYSLAIVNRRLAQALNRIKPGEIGLYSTEGPGDFDADGAFLDAHPDCAEMQRLAESTPDAEVVMRLLYPPRVTGMKGRLNGLGCYGWEESGLPDDYVTAFNQQLQFISTMSTYVTRTLIDNGVKCPLVTIGIGADHILDAKPDSAGLPDLGEGFRLLHISSCFPRKGVDCLLEAYGKAFTAVDRVSLVIKTFPNPHHDIDAQLASWRQRYPDSAAVVLINRDLDDGAIRSLYQQADALVAPSRGEGFGLPMAEAMLHDCPVITTGYGGQVDFCSEETAWLIDYSFARAQTHMGQSASVWVDPSAEHLAEIMKTFYENHSNGGWRDLVAARTSRARSLIEQQYSWQAVAERLNASLVKIDRRALIDPPLSFGSVTTWNSKCGVASYSQLLINPCLAHTVVFANDDAELISKDGANVSRCWTAGQEDDLTRLEEAILAAGLTQVLIQFNFSFFNLVAFKRLLNRLQLQSVQVLITFHSTADVYWGDELKTLRVLLPELAGARRIFVHGTDDLNRLKAFGLVDNVTLFPHGVTIPDRLNSAPSGALLKMLANKTVIASYGFILPHKGIRQLIAAFLTLSAHQPNSHLLLLTAQYPADISQREAEHCLSMIRDAGVEDRITFITDYLEDEESLAWLSVADCIVFPYQHTQESSSAAVRWGLATGRPVFCTPLPIFEDVADAVHFLPGVEVADIARGLSQALDDQQGMKAIAKKQQRWLHQHDWKLLSKRLRNLLFALSA